MMITFDLTQQMAILAWLENAKEAGLTIDDLIKGMKDGTLTSESEPNQYVSSVSEEA